MTVYLGTPGNQMHAHAASGMPVLVSYALWSPFMDDYAPTWSSLLIDSGAFSALNTGKKVDVAEYAEWAGRWERCQHVAAIACLDDIAGNWQQGWKNMEAMPPGIGFPTFHDTDPWDLLPDLCAAARERGGWIGIGVTPTKRSALGDWLRDVLAEIPDDLHVHGWALRMHWKTHPRLDSVDSTNWFRDAFGIRQRGMPMPWLSYAECVDLIVKKYQRDVRVPVVSQQKGLFA